MAYTLERFAADCRTALREQETKAARETIRACCSRACNRRRVRRDPLRARQHLGPQDHLAKTPSSDSASCPT